MHYTTCAVILAAGSSVASASASMNGLFDIPSSIRRREAFLSIGGENKGRAEKGSTAGFLGAKTAVASASKLSTPASKAVTPASKAVAPGLNLMKPLAQAVQAAQQQKTQDDAESAQIKRAAKQAAMYMDEYQKVHPPKKGQSLRDDMPPPMNFQFSNNYGTSVSNYNTNTNTYQGAYTNNNNQQFAAAGATIASNGANVKVDKSMNDYRQQAAMGATINGNNGGNRASKRSVDDTYEVKEDGRVVYRDFKLLVKAMKRNQAAKEQVLYEIAGVPGFRSLVEGLIQKYTETNGELTMNNFAALVEAMTQDKSVEVKAVDAFNSNLVYASVIEKLLMKYYKPDDQDSSSSKERRDFDSDFFKFAIRAIEEDYLELDARDFYNEYSWLAERGLDAETEELFARDLDAYLSYDPDLFY